MFDWRTCYFIGGGLGFALLLLRVGVLESGMFKSIKESNVAKGDIRILFNNGKRFEIPVQYPYRPAYLLCDRYTSCLFKRVW